MEWIRPPRRMTVFLPSNNVPASASITWQLRRINDWGGSWIQGFVASLGSLSGRLTKGQEGGRSDPVERVRGREGDRRWC